MTVPDDVLAPNSILFHWTNSMFFKMDGEISQDTAALLSVKNWFFFVFTMSSPAAILYNEFKKSYLKYSLKITATSPWGQWFNGCVHV